MADDKSNDGRPPSEIHVEGDEKKANWLPWVLLALGLIALLVGLSRCNRDRTSTTVTNTTEMTTNTVADTSSDVVGATQTAGVSGLGTYLADASGTVPRTFTFEKLNFDTAKADIRAADRAEIADIAGVLKQYPTSKIRILGFTDARGSGAANARLGQQRADAIKTALVAAGIDGSRIETGSGGEANPVDTNQTTGGQFENRRTELVVTAR